ncbi:MAG: hypothetical protein AB7S96_03640 [Candidatus Izemoplasmatales bacterium]
MLDIILAVIGIIVGLLFFGVGLRIAFYPKKFIIGMMNYKYKTKKKIEPEKKIVVFTVAMGALLMAGGGYYIFIGILSLIALGQA